MERRHGLVEVMAIHLYFCFVVGVKTNDYMELSMYSLVV